MHPDEFSSRPGLSLESVYRLTERPHPEGLDSDYGKPAVVSQCGVLSCDLSEEMIALLALGPPAA